MQPASPLFAQPRLDVAARAVRPSAVPAIRARAVGASAVRPSVIRAGPSISAGWTGPERTAVIRSAGSAVPAGWAGSEGPAVIRPAGPAVAAGRTTTAIVAIRPTRLARAAAGPGPPSVRAAARFRFGFVQSQQGGHGVGQPRGHETQQEATPATSCLFRFTDSILHSFMLVHDSLLSWSIAEIACPRAVKERRRRP